MGAPLEKADLYDIDSLYSEEEILVRDTVRSWVREEFAPLVEECYAKGEFPLEKALELAELGVFGANIQGYGCAGLS